MSIRSKQYNLIIFQLIFMILQDFDYINKYSTIK
jgi:hypothetical protein